MAEIEKIEIKPYSKKELAAHIKSEYDQWLLG